MSEPLRIVMADDNYLVREGVRRLLEDSGDIIVEAAAGSGPELLAAIERLRPDAVLTDIRMPIGDDSATPACGPETFRNPEVRKTAPGSAAHLVLPDGRRT